jgi:predicted GH43/DUF377 family glycosyl hydrolase
MELCRPGVSFILSKWRAGPSIKLATSPDLSLETSHFAGAPAAPRHDSECTHGGGPPPILTDRGWLALWHGVEPKEIVGIYRTYWSLPDRDGPATVLTTCREPLLEANPELTEPIEQPMYVRDVVFSTEIVEHDAVYIAASGEADLACRITHIPKSLFD